MNGYFRSLSNVHEGGIKGVKKEGVMTIDKGDSWDMYRQDNFFTFIGKSKYT